MPLNKETKPIKTTLKRNYFLYQRKAFFLYVEITVAEPINMSTLQMNYVNENSQKQYEGTKVR